jgi:hypothetical protein
MHDDGSRGCFSTGDAELNPQQEVLGMSLDERDRRGGRGRKAAEERGELGVRRRMQMKFGMLDRKHRVTPERPRRARLPRTMTGRTWAIPSPVSTIGISTAGDPPSGESASE